MQVFAAWAIAESMASKPSRAPSRPRLGLVARIRRLVGRPTEPATGQDQPWFDVSALKGHPTNR